MTRDETLGFCLTFFVNRDKMNAAIHGGLPKFSPITFGLADLISKTDVVLPEETIVLLDEVLGDTETYDLDHGR